MKSKSFDLKQTGLDHAKENRSFDFVKLYKSAAETKAQFDTNEVTKVAKKVKVPDTDQDDMSKRSRSPNKHKKKKTSESLDSSRIVAAAGHNSTGPMTTTPSMKPNVTSTPKTKIDKSQGNVKSIMKNLSDVEVSINVSKVSSSSVKPKKRNKSVSFMLEEGDEMIVKKSKANDSGKDVKSKDKLNKKLHKDKKKQETKITTKVRDNQSKEAMLTTLTENLSDKKVVEVRIKVKKAGKFKPPEAVQKTDEATPPGDQSAESKLKKSKKKKRKAKALQEPNVETDGEPAVKSRKKELKTETIAKGLENLNIGDNPFTLSHLLDEMSVVDKNKKKKDKQQKNNQKNIKLTKTKPDEPQDSKTEAERVKWSHRKWNKDTKGGASKPKLQHLVVVENLPINIMCSYKTVLSEHFAKFGTIAGIGVAETYPNEDPQPVFTTTIFFQDEESATKALQDDNTVLSGNGAKSRIRVRRALPPTQTTLVVRAYAELGQQALSSLFASAGRIRSIRHLVKGKKTIATAFVEFDGPEAVERALKLAADSKIGGKKMYVAKYEIREHRKKENEGEKTTAND
ncbi:uncharacterized protein [Epargyreus clarus]|uniref:uncharacterized protein n=1 Tax=Epargyreus clarus TaxID=520877 RepID=UPI003C2E751D